MPTPTITSTTLAWTVVGGADESTFYQPTLRPSVLVAGTNVIAVEIHQANATSSDISFNLALLASTNTGPTVTTAATDAFAAEAGTDPGTFTITRTGSTANLLTVNFTVGGTA